jgi:hypothetical protein
LENKCNAFEQKRNGIFYTREHIDFVETSFFIGVVSGRFEKIEQHLSWPTSNNKKVDSSIRKIASSTVYLSSDTSPVIQFSVCPGFPSIQLCLPTLQGRKSGLMAGTACIFWEFE